MKKVSVHACVVVKKTSDIFDRLEYFSSWYRAKRAVAVCIRFVRLLHARVENRLKNNQHLAKIAYARVNVNEIQHAERIILKLMQGHAYPNEVEILTKVRQKKDNTHDLPKLSLRRNSSLIKLDPYLGSDGLVRVGRRVRRANVPRDQAHPVIIPKSGHLTQLLIRHYHELTHHAGGGSTLNAIRACGYWITKARSCINSHVWKCVLCRKLRGGVSGQVMADLPYDRLEPAPPFTYSGVDLFGPLYIKEGRIEKKRWGCLFTCLATRAIHIEVAHSLSTDSFLNAYRRFIGRRGPIRQLRCDCGTNFVGAKNELHACLAEMNHDKIHNALSETNCDWIDFKFNVPHASHMAGVWERMIRSVRTVLTAILDKHSLQLDDELLHTFMAEAEAIVNSRPITYIDMSSSDSLEPLSPSQLLTLKSGVIYPLPGAFVREDLYCRKRWRRVQYLANEFWARWRKEYLPTLQQRIKWTQPKNNLQVDDVVLMVSVNVPRCEWPRAIIISIFAGKDNYVRKVSVKASTGTYDRPINKLILLYRPGVPT